jgi:hypothetical protein
MTGASAAVARLGIVAGQPQRRDDGAHDRGTALPVVHLGRSGFAGRDMALDLVESRAFPKGITIQVYRPTVALRLAAEGSKACNRKIVVRPFL